MKSYFFLSLLIISTTAYAKSFENFWNDLWYTKDQQGIKLMDRHMPADAANTFINRQWQGVAFYRSKNYAKALSAFAENKTAIGNYNRGNALAHLGKYQEAMAAYDLAIKLQSNFTDAIYNRELIKKIMQQQKKSNNNNNQQKQKNTKNSPKEEQKNDSEESSNQNEKKNNASSANQDKKNSLSQKKLTNDEPQNQELVQWLRHVEDDPGGLLRQKFLRDHLKQVENGD